MPELKKVPIIDNPIDWKAFVPDPIQLRNNIAKAVDNHIDNMVVDFINEYNQLKQMQYDEINKINRDLNKNKDGGFSPKGTGKKAKKQDEFDLMDELNALQDIEDSAGDLPKSMRESTNPSKF